MTIHQRDLAKVTNVRVIIERDLLTCEVWLDFGDSQCAFGGLSLSRFDSDAGRQVGTAMGADFILRLMQLFGVETLDAIKGRPVYALRGSSSGLVDGLEIPAPFGEGRFLLTEWTEFWKARDWK